MHAHLCVSTVLPLTSYFVPYILSAVLRLSNFSNYVARCPVQTHIFAWLCTKTFCFIFCSAAKEVCANASCRLATLINHKIRRGAKDFICRRQNVSTFLFLDIHLCIYIIFYICVRVCMSHSSLGLKLGVRQIVYKITTCFCCWHCV